MKFPSIDTLAGSLVKTLRRWPLTIALAVVGTWLLMQASNNSLFPEDLREPLWRMIACCYITMLFTIAVTVFVESRGLRLVVKVCLLALAVGLGLAFYFTLPELSTPRMIRILLLALAVHWLIAVIPYLKADDGPNGFWDYNRKLFLRALQTMLYTLTLYLGATLALLAIDHLFGVAVNSRVYENVWWFLSGTFSTIFFLAGFPRVFARPESINDYPRGLKVFTQFVLLPLVTLYLAILYAYLFKIVFTAHWPSGWVSWLVLGFAVAGILALLLIYPLRKHEDNRWINTYSRFYYLALFPLVVLLWIAICKRIGSYGITELRYFVLLLGIWLAAIAFYFVFSKGKDIRVIPASLCLLALLSLWGASSVSLAVQRGRLQAILQKDGLFMDGKVKRATKDVPLADRQKISSITDYLMDMHGCQVLQPWFRNNLDSLMRIKNAHGYGDLRDWEESTALLELMNVRYADNYGTATMTTEMTRWVDCEVREDQRAIQLDSAGFVIPDFHIDELKTEGGAGKQYFLGQESLFIQLDSSRHDLLVSRPRRQTTAVFDLRRLEVTLADSTSNDTYQQLSSARMTIRDGANGVFLTKVRAVHEGAAMHIIYAEGNLVLMK
jgi:hypothetical protein